eukprot:Rmarinus@m.9455
MVLTSKSKQELHRAMYDYLVTNGFHETADCFLKEAEMAPDATGKKQAQDILEKKWSSVVRLQKKVMDLESKISQMDEESVIARSLRGEAGKTDPLPRQPPLHVLLGHREPITSVACHPMFTIVASASEDSTIKLWDYSTGQLERTVRAHNVDVVTGLAFSADGNHLASSSNDLTIKIWRVTPNDLPCVKILRGHTHSVSSVAFVNANTIISASRDASLRVWELETGYCVRTLSGHEKWVRQVAVSPDGAMAASCAADQTVRLWDIASGNCLDTLYGHEHDVECICFLPETAAAHFNKSSQGGSSEGGATKRARPWYVASGSRDKTIRIWESSTGACVCVLEGHNNWVRGLKAHPAGKFLLSVSDDKSMRVWDLSKQRCLRTYADAHDHFVSCIDFNAVDAHVVTGGVDKSVRVWASR